MTMVFDTVDNNKTEAAPRSKTLPLRERQANRMLIVIAIVVFAALSLTLTAKLTGFGLSQTELGQPVISQPMSIALEAEGHIVVSNPQTGEVYLTYSDGRGGFFRSILRAFSLKRRAYNVPDSTPFQVTRWDSGRLTLDDPATGHSIPVDSFGRSVTDIFAPIVK